MHPKKAEAVVDAIFVLAAATWRPGNPFPSFCPLSDGIIWRCHVRWMAEEEEPHP